ncbi:MAG: GNAT family N-acetyltransferase [Oscillospiraceae bacterium]|jgi:ribosomal protein S18 acetylase RimI-like enzyme|nr:GNAT family N-acetyltransferase [Oscillospiraceae bacterium]
MDIAVRPARKEDHPAVERLLRQIAQLHADLRPEIFRPAGRKYDTERYYGLLQDTDTPILVAENREGEVLGYAMLQVKSVGENHPVLLPRTFLYIDDLCVDGDARGQGIGAALMQGVRALAKSRGIGKIELNVWECNEAAMRFYERLGFQTQRRELELDI